MDKKRGLAIGVIAIAILCVLFLISGSIAQLIDPTVNGSIRYNDWGQQVIVRNFSLNPIVLIRGTFSHYGMICLAFVCGISFVVFLYFKMTREETARRDDRNFDISAKGTYGTSGWMTRSEMLEVLSLSSPTETNGTILGTDLETSASLLNKIVPSPSACKVISLPLNSRLNKHTAIFGASGTGKSRCFVRPQIIQCAKRGESVIITDPKGEIFADTSEYLRKRGYNVKVFNLVDPNFSDSWNCLHELFANKDQIELMAQTFCEVIIKNTGGQGDSAAKDPFWDNAEMNLLKALSLLVALDDNKEGDEKNIGSVYDMLTSNDERALSREFDRLPIGHPAKAPWAIYKQAGDNVRGNVIIGLGARLQVFQSPIVKSITAHSEIDLEAPAREKCAYYVIMSDQDTTLDFLSSLFFSFLFIRTVRYADIHGVNGVCDVPINFILDEFPNIGQIPDFTKKLSTIRSRELRVAVIFQNIAQLQNRYPNGLWEEIVGNCDTHLFLGCTDQMTAKYISTRTGEMTIDVTSVALQKQSIALAQNVPSYRETNSVGKRLVLTQDEVLRWDSNKVLIIIRGQKVLQAGKFDFTLHPESKNFEKSNVRDYVPLWRSKVNAKRFGDSEIDGPTEVENVYDEEKPLDLEKDEAPSTSVPKARPTTIPSPEVNMKPVASVKPKLYNGKPTVKKDVDDF